jgi:hypothetical protein
MKRLITYSVTALLAASAISFAKTPTKDEIMKKEEAAWQAYKDKKADDFKSLVDKDIRCVYDNGIANRQKELDDMQKWEMKSFAISDFDSFSDEKDVIVTTYTVKIEGSYNGKDISGTYNSGTVWKLEDGKWLAIFHTNIKQAPAS